MKNRQEKEGSVFAYWTTRRADRDLNPGLSQVDRGDCESLHPRCPILVKTLPDSLTALRGVWPRRPQLHWVQIL